LVQIQKKSLGGLPVHFAGGSGVHVERNSHALKTVPDTGMVTVYDLLGANTLLHGPYGDGHAMLIASADELYIFLSRPLVTYVNIRRKITACEVSDMYRTIGIRKGCRHQNPVEILIHNSIKLGKNRK